MELNKFIRNDIFKIIQNCGHNPTDFNLVDVKSPYDKSNIGWVIWHKNQKYYFSIYEPPTGNDIVLVQYSPSTDGEKFEDYNHDPIAAHHYNTIANWLNLVKRDLTEIDWWEELNKINTSAKNEFEGKTIPNDINFVKSFIEEIKKKLPEAKLNENQQERIIFNLNQTINIAEKTSGNEWWIFFLGILADAAINMYLNSEQGNALWNIAKSAFTRVIGS